jgi:hypothetical protein
MVSSQPEIELEPPAGEVTNSPAHGTPRPALKILHDTLPHPLRGRLTSARELARRRRAEAEPPLPTSEPDLDRLLGGGLARGALVEVVGRRSSGRFALVLTVLAAATGTGEAAALVDLGDGLDPQSAAAAGVDLERLLWLRPRRLKEALAGAEAALAGGFPLVVVDLGLPPVAGGKGAEGFWLRLARAARDHEGALLVSAPYRASGTAAAAVLAAGRQRFAWRGRGAAPRLLGEIAIRLTVEKRRGVAPGETASLPLSTGFLPHTPAAPHPASAPRPAPTPLRLAAAG